MTKQALEHPGGLDRLDLGLLQESAASLLLQTLQDTLFIGKDVYTYVSAINGQSRQSNKPLCAGSLPNVGPEWAQVQRIHASTPASPRLMRSCFKLPLGRCCAGVWLAASGRTPACCTTALRVRTFKQLCIEPRPCVWML